jgi:hypothetical protein
MLIPVLNAPGATNFLILSLSKDAAWWSNPFDTPAEWYINRKLGQKACVLRQAQDEEIGGFHERPSGSTNVPHPELVEGR